MEQILAGHSLEDGLGEDSPLGRLYDLNSKVLLLAVGHERNTSLHLSERRAYGDAQPRIRTGSPMVINGERQWVEYDWPDVSSDDFGPLGADFEEQPNSVITAMTGSGLSRMMYQRRLVDFGTKWIRQHRDIPGSDRSEV